MERIGEEAGQVAFSFQVFSLSPQKSKHPTRFHQVLSPPPALLYSTDFLQKTSCVSCVLLSQTSQASKMEAVDMHLLFLSRSLHSTGPTPSCPIAPAGQFFLHHRHA